MQDFKISADAKRATKKIAYEMAIKLKQGEVLSDKELDSLLLYFAPSAPKVAKTAIEWVAGLSFFTGHKDFEVIGNIHQHPELLENK